MAHPRRSARPTGVVAIALLLGLTSLTASASPPPDLQAVEGIPMMLPDRRLAIFGAAGERVVVLRVASVGADQSPLVDLRDGDVIIAFQGIDDPDVAAFKAALARIETGGTLSFGVRRGAAVHSLEFPKPTSSFMIPQGARSQAEPQREPVPPRAASEIAAEVERLLVEANAAGGPGMTVAVSHDGKVVVSAARGLASLETDTPMAAQTVLPVDSVTKQFTAFGIALLVNRGELSLDDDVHRFLPELSELGQTVTVRHLLTHTSGLKDYTGLLSLTGWKHGDELTSEELVTLLSRQRELAFPPGSEHRYSNTNYALLPVIVERIVGMSFQQWMQREVFTPLGMAATSFPATSQEIILASANLYRPIDGGFERAHGGHGLAGAGGMMSTAVDLLRWARELASGEVGGQAVMELMRRPAVLDDGTEIGYALGVGVGDFRGVPRLAHSGSGPGSASVLHVYPEDDLAIAVLANYGDAEVYKLAEQIAELHLGDRLGPEPEGPRGFGTPGAFMITDEHFAGEGAPEGVPDDPETIAAFAGRYVLEDEGELTLEVDGATLLLKLLPDIPAVPLVHLGDGRYLFPPAGWELSVDQTTRPAEHIVVHITEDSIHRGDVRDMTGYRKDVRELTAADRRSLIGNYSSFELGVVYRILERGGTLFLEHPRIGLLPLTHHSGDRFGLPGRQVVRVRFHRADPDAPTSTITGLTAEAFAWGATARFDRLER